MSRHTARQDVFYRNVHIFVDRLLDAAKTHGTEIVCPVLKNGGASPLVLSITPVNSLLNGIGRTANSNFHSLNGSTKSAILMALYSKFQVEGDRTLPRHSLPPNKLHDLAYLSLCDTKCPPYHQHKPWSGNQACLTARRKPWQSNFTPQHGTYDLLYPYIDHQLLCRERDIYIMQLLM